jgi:hypothetical protein
MRILVRYNHFLSLTTTHYHSLSLTTTHYHSLPLTTVSLRDGCNADLEPSAILKLTRELLYLGDSTDFMTYSGCPVFR